MQEGEEIVFGTDGWRGVIADDFTFANVRKVTRAIAQYLSTAYNQNRPVLVGYDTRFLADRFAQVAADVLASLGWTVKISDRDCPTPAIAYAAKQHNSAGALMFTASHNPAVYCGIKYIPDYAGPATPDITDAIEANIPNASESIPSLVPAENITLFDPKPDYLQFVYTLIDCDRIRAAKLNVKYDALYSTSRGYLDTALQSCGCSTASFHTDRDVLFGGGMPDPKGDRLDDLIAAVKTDRADLGLATDGDSDRFGIVDELGNILTPNTVLMILTRHLVKNKGKTGAIVRTVATTHLLDRLAFKYGLEIYETPVGFKYIGEIMRNTKVLIGGEESGGLSITGHIPEKDGILAGLLVAEAIAYERKPLSQIAAEVIAEAGGNSYNHRIDLNLSDRQKEAAIDFFRHRPPMAIASIPIAQIGLKDGVKLYLEGGSWVLLRPSGTEPLMRVYMETETIEQQVAIAQDMQTLISSL
jgi:phosphomannomutase